MRISRQVTIDAPVSAAWGLVGDPSLYPRFMRHVARWEPITGERGDQARYRINARVGGVEMGATVEVTNASAPRELCWESVAGIEHRGRWRLEAEGDRRCTVLLELEYRAAKGVLGRVADAAALPFLKRDAKELLVRLQAEVEGRARMRGSLARVADGVRDAVYGGAVLKRSGLLALARPDRQARAWRAVLKWDATLAGGCSAAAALYPDDLALVDERRSVTFAELHRRTNALARGLREVGVEPGQRVAILCRNHAWFAEAVLAASKLGADVLLLNTGLAAPQLREVLRREEPRALIADQEFDQAATIHGLTRFLAWQESPSGATTLDELVTGNDPSELPRPRRHGRVVILTSGTTGPPKAAARRESEHLGVPLAVLGSIPLRARKVTHIGSPLSHSWGYMHFGLAIATRGTLLLRRRFDPERLLRDIERERIDSLVLVPTMLMRMVEQVAVRGRYDTSSLRLVAVSGSALPGDLATRFMDAFGDVLYNLYGSTEVSWATIAAPSDLRAAPGTAGRPPRGTRVAILDKRGRPMPAGSPGLIFAGNETTFDGYTDGTGPHAIGGLISTGDIGHLDDAGRLFVDGREDDMIVSGGENIFPSEVEDALAHHPAVAEVAVVGIEDERFGQRLKAYVITAPGTAVSERDLKELVRTKLAPFKVPREIEFVTELPHTETGKVTRHGLGNEPRRA